MVTQSGVVGCPTPASVSRTTADSFGESPCLANANTPYSGPSGTRAYRVRVRPPPRAALVDSGAMASTNRCSDSYSCGHANIRGYAYSDRDPYAIFTSAHINTYSFAHGGSSPHTNADALADSHADPYADPYADPHADPRTDPRTRKSGCDRRAALACRWNHGMGRVRCRYAEGDIRRG